LDGSRATGAAFAVRAGESYLSVNWLEHTGRDSRDEEISDLRQALNEKLTTKRKDRIAVARVGHAIDNVRGGSSDNRELTVQHEPSRGDPSHSGVYGLRQDDDMLVGDLLAETFTEMYPTRR
jgi:hypothetical protein